MMSYPALSPLAQLHVPPYAVRLSRIARWISNASQPPLVGVLCLVLVALWTQAANGQGGLTTAEPKWSWQPWLWSAEYLAVAVLMPTVYVYWLMRRGQVSDMQLQIRQQRIKPYCAALGCMTAAAGLLLFTHAPHIFVQVGWANVAQMALLFALTLRWKVSAHSASAAGLAVLACKLMGLAGLPFCALVPIVAWSRVRLGRHDALQTVAGTLIGMGVVLTMLAF